MKAPETCLCEKCGKNIPICQKLCRKCEEAQKEYNKELKKVKHNQRIN